MKMNDGRSPWERKQRFLSGRKIILCCMHRTIIAIPCILSMLPLRSCTRTGSSSTCPISSLDTEWDRKHFRPLCNILNPDSNAWSSVFLLWALFPSCRMRRKCKHALSVYGFWNAKNHEKRVTVVDLSWTIYVMPCLMDKFTKQTMSQSVPTL